MTSQHDARMGETIELICNLGEITSGRRGRAALTHTRLGLDAIQALYEASDDDRAALARIVAQHRTIYDSYLSLQEVADLFKVKRKVIKGLARCRHLHGYKRGGAWVFSPREVERFVEQHSYQCGVLTIAVEEWQVHQNGE